MFLFFASLITGVVSARRPRIPRIPRPGRGHRNFIEYIPVQLDSDIDEYNDFEEDEDLIIEMNGRGPRGLRPVRGNLGVVSHEPITSHSKGFRSSIRFPFWIKMTPTPKPKSVVGKYTFLDYNDFE